MNLREEIYDELCKVLTDYEGNGDESMKGNASILYDVLVKIQNNWDDISQCELREKFRRTVNEATDEIFGSLAVAATGNYWLGEYWNLFCEKEQLCGSRYFVVKLERYGDSEECQDFEFDTEETNTDTEVELRIAIEQIIKRNMFLLEEV